MLLQKNFNIPRAQNLCNSNWRTQQQKVQSLQFGLLSSDDIQKLSVAEICSEMPYQENGYPNFQGINDPRLGTNSRDFKCITCKGSMEECPGHFGHINLARRVYHIGFLNHTIKTLRSVCFNCSNLLIARDKEGQDYAYLSNCKSAKTRFNHCYSASTKGTALICDQKSGGCGYKQPKMSKQGIGIKIEYTDENVDQTKDRKQTLSADEAYHVLRKIKEEDLWLLGFNNELGRPDSMIIKNLVVAPPPMRPSVQMPGGMRSEDDLTFAYQQIIKTNRLLKTQIEKGTNQSTINEILQCLQFFVATLMDNDICGQPKQKHKSGKALRTIRARLKGKEGRLRGNLMGKRVDFSSRTVITPDPNLKLEQLGVPYDIATNLTFPETVTPYNFDEMKRLIQNGPVNWPGAKYIIRHDERQIDLSALRNRSDAHIEVGYKVERHIKDGDYVIFNRQPSLHKMSVMGHRVKILPYSTFRMNLSVTSPYNADFDGDEMNMHVPQSFETISEIKEIMMVPKQIMNPQSNKPIMGIVQDSLLGCMIFTQRDTFITREDLYNLSMWIDDIDQIPPPAILKPKCLWTGKQVMSLILPNIQYVRYNETRGKHKWASALDKNILIRNGELLCGQLTKGQVGNTGGGIVHIIWKEFGAEACSAFLSQTQCVVNNWLVLHGFTVGVQDIIARHQTMDLIRTTLKKQLKKVQKIVHYSHIGKLKSQPGKGMIESFEAQVNQQLNDARDKSGNIALEDLSNSNRLRNMVQAGSKGNNINISQIMACVGQQNVEGKRIPFGFQKRSLPHFTKDDFGPESKGFVENSYFLGLSPSELYFHAMGGREGLIDTAVKTAETGYISRRLMKAMEDVMVKYDGTVRSSRQHIVQFAYGEDGMAGEHIEDMSIDLLKMDDKQLKIKYDFNSADIEQQRLLEIFEDPDIANQIASDPIISKALFEEFDQIRKDRQVLRNSIFRMTNDDAIHLPINLRRIIQNAKMMFDISGRSKTDLKPTDVIQKLQESLKQLCAIPSLQHQKNRYLLEANEDATLLLKIYIRSILNSKNVLIKERLNTKAFDWILGEIKSKYEQGLVNPGEMVGPLAAHGMGEPATQMTLNTFHFAGVSAKNVTLGVPRLKEIINVSKSIKTPSLKIFLEDRYRKNEKIVTNVGGQIEYTTLQHVVSSSQIFYDPDPQKTIIKADEQLVTLYNEIPALENEAQDSSNSPWVVRFELDNERMVQKDLTISAIDKMLHEVFGEQISVMHSDENAESQVIRVRIAGLEEEDPQEHAGLLKEFLESIFKDMIIKGLVEISKVTFTKHIESDYDPITGKFVQTDDNWIIETDGVCLRRILTIDKVDHRRTQSNDCLEIQQVLGIEAARQSLINELRFVLNSYGIYVNYRHLATLTDIMTQRGKLMSIARHGINRIDSGALRKCSFEETVEILVEAAVYSENDHLSGITENIIMGQIAPMGTGAFSLNVDSQMVLKKALDYKDQYGEDFDDSPSANFINQELDATPLASSERAPDQIYNSPNGAASIYGAQTVMPGMTPGGANPLGFSPGYNNFGSPNFYASPAHYHASPGYSSPTGQSPIYTGANAYNVTSPQYMATSPIYQMPNTSQRQGSGPYGNSNRIGPIGAQNQQSSPKYSPNAVKSPTIGNPNKFVCSSPIYMPSGVGGAQIPGYGAMPGQMNGKSPAYSPTQSMKQLSPPLGRMGPSPVGPSGLNASPSYSPNVLNKQGGPLAYSPNVLYPAKTPKSDDPIQTPDLTKSPLAPGGSHIETPIGPIQSPAYNPLASPVYGQESQGKTGQIENGRPAAYQDYSLSSPMYQQNNDQQQYGNSKKN